MKFGKIFVFWISLLVSSLVVALLGLGAVAQAMQSEVTCFAGGCLHAGWQSQGLRPQDTYTVECYGYNCAGQGWLTYYAHGGQEQTQCMGRGCFIDGWRTYSPQGYILSSAQCYTGYSGWPYNYYPPYGYPPYGYNDDYGLGGGGFGGGLMWPCLSGGWVMQYHSGPSWMGPWWGAWGNWWNSTQQINMRCIQNNCSAWGWNFRNPNAWGGHGQVRCKQGGCFTTGWVVY